MVSLHHHHQQKKAASGENEKIKEEEEKKKYQKYERNFQKIKKKIEKNIIEWCGNSSSRAAMQAYATRRLYIYL
jgi:hypothetical protein